METHYNAFISYRHAAVDTRIAREVQHQLENYHIPKALQEKTGIKKIDRVFRDQEELPITMDINEDIGSAIRNADFLILICSPRTQQSQWVMREIDLFLQTHTKRQILTVLAEGEPEEIVPDLLRYEERIDPLTGEMVSFPVEPLSCDYRLPLRKARQIELPRLLAALLGVSYDEIRQRRHQYEMRRRTIILSIVSTVLLVFLAYFAYSNAQIRAINDKLEESYIEVKANLEQSQRNQSYYLATESMNALSDGDRLLATNLALAALPSETEERPETAIAVYALSQAVNAYDPTPGTVAVGAYTTDGYPQDYFLNSDRTLLYIYDDTNTITYWGVETYDCRVTLHPGCEINEICLADDEHLIAVCSYDNPVICYDAVSGEELWRLDVNVLRACVLPDGQHVLLCGYNSSYQIVETASGKSVYSGNAEVPENVYACTLHYTQENRVSPDGRYLAAYISYDDEYHPVLLDLTDYSLTVLDRPYVLIEDLSFTADGNLLVLGYDASVDLYRTSISYNNSYSQTYTRSLTVDCYASPEELLWSSAFDCYGMQDLSRLDLCGDGETFLAVFSNSLVWMKQSDGSILQRFEVDAQIEYFSNEGDYEFLITKDGSNVIVYYQEGRVSGINLTAGDILQVRQGHGIYILQDDSRKIIRYRSSYDENFTAWDVDVSSGISSCCCGSDKTALVTTDNRLLLVNNETGAICQELSLEDYQGSCSSYVYDGFSSDESCLYFHFDLPAQDYPVFALSIEKGSVTRLSHVEANEVLCQVVSDAGDGFVTLGKTNTYGAGTWWIAAQAWEDDSPSSRIELTFDPQTDTLSAGPKAYALLDTEGSLHLIDRENGTDTDTGLLCNPDTLQLAWSEDGSTLAVAATEELLLLDANGAVLSHLDHNPQDLVSLAFSPYDRLFVLMGKGKLYTYSAAGQSLGQITAPYATLSNYYSAVHWYFPSEDRAWFFFDKTVAIIYDLEDLEPRSLLYSAIALLPDSEQVLSLNTFGNSYELGTYGIYSTGDLITMGQELVASAPLTDEVKAQYGIAIGENTDD